MTVEAPVTFDKNENDAFMKDLSNTNKNHTRRIKELQGNFDEARARIDRLLKRSSTSRPSDSSLDRSRKTSDVLRKSSVQSNGSMKMSSDTSNGSKKIGSDKSNASMRSQASIDSTRSQGGIELVRSESSIDTKDAGSRTRNVSATIRPAKQEKNEKHTTNINVKPTTKNMTFGMVSLKVKIEGE